MLGTTLTAQVPNSLSDYFQQNNIEAQNANDGLFYQIDERGSERFPQTGEYVIVKYKGMLLDGTVFDQSDDSDPFVFQLGYRQVIRGWDKGLINFSEGSIGKLYVPASLGYGDRGVRDQVPANSDLIYEIELVRIMDFEAYDQYMVELEKKERRVYEQHIKTQFLKDKKIIQEYSIDNKLRAKRLPSGLSYAITKKGKGDKAQAGDLLTVQYEGRLANGEVFDATKGRETFEFMLGAKKVIPGWDEGLKYFKKGGEGWLLIPSKMAYGPREIKEDDIYIPGDAVLVFKIKVVDIRREVAKR